MKTLLLIVYLLGGQPKMETRFYEDITLCVLDGQIRLNKLAMNDRVVIHFARCILVEATEVNSKKEKSDNNNG